ncbi:hypothetical protein GMA8713_02367 [Grimontia marina]|uniref:Transposase n=1 Tax=Grimontia marina TaxID=646534 RepID=A0A128F7Q6_9GAMM|nr:hypothetical protein GMA8713_02367 [Grimontia marina]
MKDLRVHDVEVTDAINAVLEKAPNARFWKCFWLIKRKHKRFNHKCVYRVYCRMGLNLQHRQKRVLPR